MSSQFSRSTTNIKAKKQWKVINGQWINTAADVETDGQPTSKSHDLKYGSLDRKLVGNRKAIFENGFTKQNGHLPKEQISNRVSNGLRSRENSLDPIISHTPKVLLHNKQTENGTTKSEMITKDEIPSANVFENNSSKVEKDIEQTNETKDEPIKKTPINITSKKTLKSTVHDFTAKFNGFSTDQQSTKGKTLQRTAILRKTQDLNYGSLDRQLYRKKRTELVMQKRLSKDDKSLCSVFVRPHKTGIKRYTSVYYRFK